MNKNGTRLKQEGEVGMAAILQQFAGIARTIVAQMSGLAKESAQELPVTAAHGGFGHG